MTKTEFARRLADAVTMYRRGVANLGQQNTDAVVAGCAKDAGLVLTTSDEGAFILGVISRVCFLDRSHPEFALRIWAFMEEAYEAHQKMAGPREVQHE